ncbi:hypothetical protein ACP6RX_002458, partial [Cronobacter turicensis]
YDGDIVANGTCSPTWYISLIPASLKGNKRKRRRHLKGGCATLTHPTVTDGPIFFSRSKTIPITID